ncbi:hypothetical protein HOD96_01680 [Candidatus Falkowbacteria bacterium]|jgi:hypothetical protein|nr:hypothetical protein [Candidatus Falkowbacteria bacterium]MBT4433329.1 hypothetical protein [Candidatus Falkowbacteria bacterium]
MTNTQSWEMAISGSMQDLWMRSIGFLPNLFGAIIIFAVGLMIAISLGVLFTKLLEKLKVDKAADEIGLTHMLEQGEIKVSIPTIIGEIVKWFLIIASLMAATDILGLPQITYFLNSILLYVPNVIVAAIILAVTVIVANFVNHIVHKGGRATKVAHSHIFGAMSKWAIIIFGVMAALVQLGIATSLISILFSGIIGMLALAGGLAFGLGGKDKAAQILNQMPCKCNGKKK